MHSDLKAEAAVFGKSVRRECDARDSPAGGFQCPDAPGCLPTIQLRHLAIHQKQIKGDVGRRRGARNLNPFLKLTARGTTTNANATR